jgi:hypothetical protein
MFFDGAHGWNIDIDTETEQLNSVRSFGGWTGLVVEGMYMHAVGS